MPLISTASFSESRACDDQTDKVPDQSVSRPNDTATFTGTGGRRSPSAPAGIGLKTGGDTRTDEIMGGGGAATGTAMAKMIDNKDYKKVPYIEGPALTLCF